jgi:hypothetical protein
MLVSLMLAAAAAVAPSAISQRDPATFMRQLAEMGYKLDPAENKGTTVQASLHLDDRTLAIVLAGCTNNRDCNYVALVGVYTDINRAPAAWVEKENANYDLIKVWVRDDGALAYSAGVVVEGMPRASFRSWVDLYVQSANALAQDATTAGYVK